MRYLIIRVGAYGDAVITTPLIRSLKNRGHEVYYLGSERSELVLRNNPNIDKFILHKKNSVDNDKLEEYFKSVSNEHGCDKYIDLCESVEVRLAVSESYPQWNWTKKERSAYCNRNYYEYTFEHAGIEVDDNLRPELFFTQEEEDFIADIRKDLIGNRIIMWGLSGSGRQKTYPYVPYIVGDLMREYKDIVVVLVGGETCKILECALPKHHRILKKSGEFNLRQSALLAKYSDLIVSPDTGFLHCSGAFDVPKIGLLTHTTIENITKHFKNDYSIESKAVCAPCFRLITNAADECPIEEESHACLCMSKEGIDPEDVLTRIKGVLDGKIRDSV